MCSQEVRRIDVRRLSGDKANLYKQKKKNRLCEFVVCAE